MLAKISFQQSSELSLTSKTVIKFDENLEFTVAPSKDSEGCDCYQIEDVKGDLEITSIKRRGNSPYGSTYEYKLPYDNITKTFEYLPYSVFSFSVVGAVDMKEVSAAYYHLHIHYYRIQCLQLYECFQSKIVLPEYDGLEFPYCVKRIKNGGSNNAIEIHIKNPYNARIQGKKEDYIVQQSEKDVNLYLSFVVEPVASNVSGLDGDGSEIDNTSNVISTDIEKCSATNSSETENDVKEPPPKRSRTDSSSKTTSKWYKIMSNNQYSDVTLISSDNIEIQSHRCLLSEHSQIFAKIFDETSELPVTINVEEFDADIIQAALDFLYDKTDSINGKEIEVFKFAEKYGIEDIMDACCLFFEKSVDPSNVCEYIQIAYSNNFEELKQKCLKTLVEKKKEIDSTKFADLPKNILIDYFSV